MNNTNNDMIENLKQMMGEKQVNDALSQISPEMIENFSKMMNNNNNAENPNDSTDFNNSTNSAKSNGGSENNFNIDMETMMKMKAMIDKLNSNQNNPRTNLLNSLKPYMRESRKENIDKYANLLKMADLMSFLNDENNKKERNSDE